MLSRMPLGRRLWHASPAKLRRTAQWAIRRLPGRRVAWGTLRRTSPFSPWFGYERGTPVDRPAIESFLQEHHRDVRGRVAEVKDSIYAQRFGGAQVADVTVVDVEPNNTHATLLADLCLPGSLPLEAFDCWVLTQTLQFLPDPHAAIRNVFDSLAPGGVLLVTVPALSRISPEAKGADFWRFTPAGLAHLLQSLLPAAAIEVGGHGNVLLAVAFLLGLAAEELTPGELALNDPEFPILSWGRVAKPAAP